MKDNPYYPKADPSAHLGATEGCGTPLETRQERIVREFNDLLREDARKFEAVSTKAMPSANCAVPRQNPRRLIEERIQFHNQQSHNLYALLRGLPQEMSPEAENALTSIIIDARLRF